VRIHDIEVESFGILQNCKLDFKPGFQVVYGPNEAGKSTLLELIRSILFGVDARTPYDFGAGETTASALVELDAGSRYKVRRRKGRKNVLQGMNLDTGETIEADDFTKLAGSVTDTMYRQVFAFSLNELSQGQESLQSLDLGEALYSSGLGGLGHFQKMMKALDAETEAWFKPTRRASKPPLNELLGKLEEIDRQLREVVVDPSFYEQQRAKVHQLEQHVKEAFELGEAARQTLQDWTRLGEAIPLFQELNELQTRLAEIDLPDSVTADFVSRFDKLVEQRDELIRLQTQLREQMESAQEELDSLARNPEILAAADTIKALVQQISQIKGFRRDLPIRKQEADALKRQVNIRLRELHDDWTLDQLRQFRTSTADRLRLEEVGRRLQVAKEALQSLESNKAPLESEIEWLESQLAELPDITVSRELTVLVEEAAEFEAGASRFSELRQEAAMLDVDCVNETKKLKGRLPTSPETIDFDAFPSESDIDAAVTEYRKLQNTLSQAERAVATAENEIKEIGTQLNKLQQQHTAASLEELHESRQQRDAVVRQLCEKPDKKENLSEAKQLLPVKVQHADDIADARYAVAKLLTQQEELSRRQEKARTQLASAQTAASEAQAIADAENQRWNGLWQSAGIVPQEPPKMQDWLRSAEKLRRLQADFEKTNRRAEIVRVDRERFETRLRTAIGDGGMFPELLISEARQRVNSATEHARRRDHLNQELQRQKRQLTELDERLKETRLRVDQHRDDWLKVLEDLGLPTDWTVGIAEKLLSGLAEAWQKYEQVQAMEQRIEAMQRDLKDFEDAAVKVIHACKVVGKEETEQTISELSAQLETLQTADIRRGEMTKQLELQRKREKEQANLLEKLDEELLVLVAQAGMKDVEGFSARRPEFLRRSQLQQGVEKTRIALEQYRGTQSSTDFAEHLTKLDAATIAIHEGEAKISQQKTQREYEEALLQLQKAKETLDEFDTESKSLSISQQREDLRARFVDAVDQWAPLVLAGELTRRAIRRFEEQHQPELLKRICRYLKQLTCDRYVDFGPRFDDEKSLQVVADDGTALVPSQLSTGTREQLYLAMRLAYIEHYSNSAESLPLVLDDVLVNFDEERLTAAVKALIELSQHCQVMLFTCHKFVVQRIADLDSTLAVLDLSQVRSSKHSSSKTASLLS
jgi:uncharacterized protein YhaN